MKVMEEKKKRPLPYSKTFLRKLYGPPDPEFAGFHAFSNICGTNTLFIHLQLWNNLLKEKVVFFLNF